MSKLTENVMLCNRGYGLINPKLTTDTEMKAYVKAIELLHENPVSYAEFPSLFETQVGYKFTIPMVNLLMSFENEEFTQYAISIKKVLVLLTSPTDGLLTGNKLSRHIEAAFEPGNVREDGSVIDLERVIIGGGRHRLTALIFILTISQMILRGLKPLELIEKGDLDDFADLSNEILNEDELLNLQVPVQPVLYSLQYVLRSNQSRTMDASEKAFLELQCKGIDITLVDIANSVHKKEITPNKGWAVMFGLLGSREDIGLTTLSYYQLGAKVYNILKSERYMFPSNPDNLLKLIQALWDNTKIQVKIQRENGISNMARYGVPAIASNLAGYAMVNSHKLWDSNSEVPKDVVAPKKSATRKRASKAKVVEDVADE